MGFSAKQQKEILIVIAILIVHGMAFCRLLSGETTIVHDNLLWNYPIFFHYFSELSRGHLPLYNFYSRLGEPFVPMAAQMRLWDPVQTLIGLASWSIFSDRIQAFGVFRYAIGVLQGLGIYFLFRTYTTRLTVRTLLLLAILFGSVFIGPFRQDGILNQYLWVPYILLLLRARFIERAPSFPDGMLLGVLIGLCFQSYFFVFTLTFTSLYFGLAYAMKIPVAVLRSGRVFARAVLAVLITATPMTVLNFVGHSESWDWTFPARTAAKEPDLVDHFDPARLLVPASKSVSVLGGGANSRMWDYIQIWSPFGSRGMMLNTPLGYGDPSEAFLFFGILPVTLALFGLSLRRRRWDYVWLNLLCLFFLLSLGPDVGLYNVLAKAFPPFRFVRNMHCLVAFVNLGILYFFVRGGERVFAVAKIYRRKLA